jgi:hypothetical protein
MMAAAVERPSHDLFCRKHATMAERTPSVSAIDRRGREIREWKSRT